MAPTSDLYFTVDAEATSDFSYPENPGPENFELHTHDALTASHALAGVKPQQSDKDIASVGVKPGNNEVRDAATFQPHILGMSKEDVWVIIRRFNFLVFRVKATKHQPISDLDMGSIEQGKTSPEQLQAQFARLYMTVIIGLFAFYKHVARLRSWTEPQRTSKFLSVYVAAWLVNLLSPTILIFLMVMFVSPASRHACFPAVPPSTVDATTGGVQRPPAGVMASDTSITGAPENCKGEAIEQEAHSFITSFSKLIMRITSDNNEPESSPEDDPSPGIAKLSGKIANAKSKTDQDGKAPNNDKTAEPMKHAIEDFNPQPLLDMFFDFIDTWERFANALNPIPLFPSDDSRLFLAVCLALPTLFTFCLSRDTIIKTMELLLGFVIFGKPVIQRSYNFLDLKYPRWRSYCELRHTILKGAPTNAQLAITMLRVSERISSPLPPPPVANSSPIMEPIATPDSVPQLGRHFLSISSILFRQLTVEAFNAQVQEVIKPDFSDSSQDSNDEHRSKHLERFMGFIKHNSKRSVDLFHKADKVRANFGDTGAQARLDLGQTTRRVPDAGPFKFPARYNGAAGYLHLATAATTPSVAWRSHDENLDTAWAVMINDIEGISKVDGMSFKTKHFVQWALDKESVNGLKLTTSSGECYHLDPAVKRDEIFNRLIAMGNQIWEVC